MTNSNSGQVENGNKRLDCWKDIATYLGRDVTTAMRWERERALPVHRVPGNAKRQTVYAYPKEIDDWLLGKGIRDSRLGVGEEKTEDTSQKLDVRSLRIENSKTDKEPSRNQKPTKEQAYPAAEIARDGEEKDALAPWMAALIPRSRWQFVGFLLIGAFVGLAAVVVYGLTRPPAIPTLVGSHHITNDGRLKEGPIVTDGARIYFPELTQSGWIIAQVPATGGEVKPLSTFFGHPSVQDLSRSHSEMLVLDPVSVPRKPELWVMPLSDGSPRRVGNINANAAALTPDGNSIIYAADSELSECGLDGSNARRIASLPGRISSLRLSPDGKVIRLNTGRPNQEEMEIWEVRADGSNAHPLLSNWHGSYSQGDGEWTPDGKYYVFGSTNGSGWDLWALSQKTGIFEARPTLPLKLTSGPLSAQHWTSSPEGMTSFAIEEGARDQLLRFNRDSGQFVAYLPEISAPYVDFSRDGNWLAYTDTNAGSLWKSRSDGSQAVRMTYQFNGIELPRWSADGKQIAFMGVKQGDLTWKVYVIPAEGGEPRVALPSASPQGAPTWSPDSHRIAFGDLREAAGKFPNPTAIHIVDLASRETSTIPGSTGLWTARWSPDGRHVAAITADSKKLKVFDFQTGQWQEVASAGSISDLNWSRNGDGLFFLDVLPASSPTIYRVRLQDRKVEKIVILAGSNTSDSAWLGVAPDDSVLISKSVGSSEIYALDIDWH